MIKNKTETAKLLKVSRSSLYYHYKKPVQDDLIRQQIEAVMLENPGYGHRRVALALKINHKKALRIMKKYNLKPARRSIPPNYLITENQPKNYPNVSMILSPIAPNIIWVADFTYIKFQNKFIYLATVLDLFTREIVGFSIKQNHNLEFITDAFNMAVANSKALPEWFHSDKGSEYRSNEFEALLTALNIKISVSPRPWHNGYQESFFGRFKIEFGDFERFETLGQLIEAIYLAINYYNNFRIHTSLKTSPAKFKNEFENRKISIPP